MHLEPGWRDRLWAEIERPWDLVIIGGGITGAGMFREAVGAGLRVLLVERDDFGGGTSCASSKLVHGGLRYLAAGDWRLTRESVRERQALISAAPGLVEPLDFLVPMYAGNKPGRLAMGAALSVYDLMARRWQSRYLRREAANWRLPYLRQEGFKGAFAYPDARTDDAALVLRVLGEGVAGGGRVVNYCGVEALNHSNGEITGVRVHDRVLDRRADVPARAVINATGPWADQLRAEVGGQPRLRPLRGSHFVFDHARLPMAQAATLFHPRDQRPLFASPWLGITVFGTTDLDHPGWPETPARMTDAEAEYLIEALAHYFPTLGLQREDALSCYTGVRPVVAGGADDPSEESRDSGIWLENGLLTVTGGKLTTYRVTAQQALYRFADKFTLLRWLDLRDPILEPAGSGRLAGRFGGDARAMQAELPEAEFEPVAGSAHTWAELRWSLRHEAVVTLADLMLHRTRLGLLLPDGGAAILDDVGRLCREELGWDTTRWWHERTAYLEQWRAEHAPQAG